MTMRGGSVCLIADQAALSHYVIQSAGLAYFTPFSLLGKTPCTFPVDRLVSRVKITPLATERTKPPRQTVFAISNENSEIEQGGPSYCTDDSMSTFSQCEETSDDPKKEAVSFVLSSGEDQLQDDEDQGNQENLLDRLKAVNLHVLAMEQWNASRLKQCHRSYLVSAANLVHYLALKSLDVEQLKEDLSSLGLLNLETMKPFVLPSLSAGIEMLDNMKPNSPKSSAVAEQVTSETILNKPKKSKYTPNTMMKRVVSNMELLLGSLPNEKTTHIMVTVGQEAIESETHIPDLLKAGTTVIRINCAHGNPSVWNEMIRRVKRSSQMLEKPCRILMDLAGPKFRTDKLKPGPCVMKISPKRNACGDVIYPAQVWLSPQGAGPPPSHISLDAVVYVDNQEFIRKVEVGDTVRFYDARGKQRMLKISKKFSVFSGVGFMADCHKTAYIQSGTELYAKRKKQNVSVGFVMDVPPAERFVRLKIGDLLTISRENPNEQDESFCSSSNSHRVTCSSGYLFDSVKPGEVIAFDDGKIWGVIKGTSTSEFIVSITHASPRGSKLGSEKSINIPDSNIRFEGLTSKDLMDLDFVATHADMVGVSFVRDVNDIVLIRQELEKRKLRNLGLVLKIETKGGFEKLPLMLLEAMKLPNPLGVMIARGDLAVECGFERLADIQEEIISICSAAHLPVIWATQVLESLVKSGVPTRAEITDVANARRASCVMLNKGKHITEAVCSLDTILNRRSAKVKPELKPLALSNPLF